MKIKPHIYSPDYQATGDCRVCGHAMNRTWHLYTTPQSTAGVKAEPDLPFEKATPAQPAGMREALATALARRLCQLFDSGGESQRSVRARHASAIFQLLSAGTSDSREWQKCDADPVTYLEDCERRAALPAERPAVAQAARARTDRLEEERNVLQNSYGYNAYMDGLVTRRIAEINKELDGNGDINGKL